ncbi:hypothetical protein AB0P15_35385 [Streptomyces sp. NPDC087917]|uniref:hypothetical protein n=1 Tax=Streptomyces sp. NPDC087917 TaxID=3155060 RepID=UPI0034250043
MTTTTERWNAATGPEPVRSPDAGAPGEAERAAILDWAIAQYEHHGWRLRSRSPGQVVMVRPKDVNHALHAILTVFTWFWALVWITFAVTRTTERVALSVEPDGRVRVDRF